VAGLHHLLSAGGVPADWFVDAVRFPRLDYVCLPKQSPALAIARCCARSQIVSPTYVFSYIPKSYASFDKVPHKKQQTARFTHVNTRKQRWRNCRKQEKHLNHLPVHVSE
jgi:hypothetical protein